MTLHSIRTITPVVVVLVAAAGVAAQQANAPAVLAAPQVRQLLISNQPADHARLKAHFEALSAKYSADAARHTAFAHASAGIPRGVGAAAEAHHARLAAKATQSATLLSELAMHHGRLAAGLASTPPPGSEQFDQGAGAPPTPTEKQLLELAGKAQTPREHQELSDYYTTLAARYSADARAHRAAAQAYLGQNRMNLPAIADRERLARLSEKSAKQAQALASEHKQMAAGR